jgi:hypothetical protein
LIFRIASREAIQLDTVRSSAARYILQEKKMAELQSMSTNKMKLG